MVQVEESSSEEEDSSVEEVKSKKQPAPKKKQPAPKKKSKKIYHLELPVQEDVSTIGGSIGANFGALTMEEKRKQLAIMTKQLEDEEVAVASSSKMG